MDLVAASKKIVIVVVDNALRAAIHVHNLPSMRREIWEHLALVAGQHSMMILGYFSCVLWYEEKQGGRLPNASAMVEFQQAMEIASLQEVSYIGRYYTWCNNRKSKQRIVSKIDWVITNSHWDSRYQEWVGKLHGIFSV